MDERQPARPGVRYARRSSASDARAGKLEPDVGDDRRLGVEVVVGALDRALDELAVQRSVDDDRTPGLELDQHAGRARLVDIFPNWIADRFAETMA